MLHFFSVGNYIKYFKGLFSVFLSSGICSEVLINVIKVFIISNNFHFCVLLVLWV